MKRTQDFVCKGKDVFIGLEDSKKTWRLAVRCENIALIQPAMEAKYSVLGTYLGNKFPDCRIRIAYEAGFRGFNLHDRLVADGHDCVVVPPNRVHQEKSNSQKNDTKDARLLANMAQFFPNVKCTVPSVEAREDREVIRLYETVKRQIISAKNRIRKKLVFHGLEEYFSVKDDWGDGEYAKIAGVLERQGIDGSLSFSLEQLLAQLRYYQEQKKLVLKKLHELAKSPTYAKNVGILRSVPGIGPFMSIGILLEIAGDMRRFAHRAQWGSFLGFVPRDMSSGESDRKGHISCEGNTRLRSWFIEASWTAIRKDPVLLAKYQDVKKRTNSGKKAIVAVAHKLALRCRRLLLKGEPYQIGLLEETI